VADLVYLTFLVGRRVVPRSTIVFLLVICLPLVTRKINHSLHLPRINLEPTFSKSYSCIDSSLPPSCGINYKFDTLYSSSEVLRDSSVRLRNPPIVVKKYQQAFLSSLPRKVTDIEFIRLNLLARLFIVILVSLSFFLISYHYLTWSWPTSPFMIFLHPRLLM
jgi:hypothetical protein